MRRDHDFSSPNHDSLAKGERATRQKATDVPLRRLRLSRADEEDEKTKEEADEDTHEETHEAEASHKSRVAIARTNDSS